MQIPEVGRDGNECTDEDTEICKAFSTDIEVVDFDEDDHEGLEPDIQDAVDEGDVKVEEKDHGLGEVEGERSDERHHDDGLRSHALGHKLWLADKLVISSNLAEALGAAYKNVVGACFGEEEEKKGETEGTYPHQLPDGPSPGCGEAAFNRS